MRERLLGRQLERRKLGRGGARGEGTAPSGLACRDGGIAERQWLIPRAPEVNGVRAGLGGQWRVGRGKGGVGGAAGRRGSNGDAAGAARRQQGGSRAASGGRQRLSAAAGARAACLDACARSEGESARERERREEKGSEEREKKVHCLT